MIEQEEPDKLKKLRIESRERHMKAYNLNLKNGNKHEAMTELWMADFYQIEDPVESAKINTKTVDLSDVMSGNNLLEIITYMHIRIISKHMQGEIECQNI